MYINIFGSTGIIGSKSLDIICNYFPELKIDLLLASNNAKKLISFYSEAGRLSTKNYCFYTKKINKISKKEKGINIHLYSKNKIINLIKQNRFSNSPHIAAFFYYLNLK